MNRMCVLSDFDGTITQKDGLYGFFVENACGDWHKIEQDWQENKINSKECLKCEFESVPNLNEKLIDNYLKTVKIDEYFKEFLQTINKNNIDLFIVSDGVDYFINRILKLNEIENIKIISNHFEIKGNEFKLTFPNENKLCKKQSGTCKCAVVKEMRKKYEQILYIGDGTSDFCVCNKADVLFAKGKLYNYCKQNEIDCIKFEKFNNITDYLFNII